MHYQNALELKHRLLAENLQRFCPTAPGIPLALGIQGRGSSYRLALRVQYNYPGIQAAVDYIRQRSKGEYELRLVGMVRKQAPWHRRRNRPLMIGGSVGHHGVRAAGTLGCFVHRRGRPDTDFLLSNNHVLANENRARRGDPILQQAPLDGGRRPAERIGTLARVTLLKRAGNRVDAALASLDDGLEYYVNWLDGLGGISGLRSTPPEAGERVYKLGRTTGRTAGRVSAIEMDALQVEYDTGTRRFDGQIEVAPEGGEPFSLAGDSGAVVVDEKLRVVGLLFAGNDVDATYINPVSEIQSAMNVEVSL